MPTTTSTVDAANTTGARSTRGKVPISKPSLNGEDLDITVTDMTVTTSEGQHDTATLSCISTTLENTDDIVNGSISFYYGVPPRTTILFGYVTSVTDEQESQGSLSFTLKILGATKVMNESIPKFWSNITMSTVMRQLVERNLLGVAGHTQDNIWRSLAQTDMSDWEQINAFAKRIGWVVYSRYGIVLFYDPIKLFNEGGSYTRLVSGQDKLADDDRNLIDFQATQVSDVVSEIMGAKFSYFTSADDVQTSTQNGEFDGYKFMSSQTVRDQVEAAAYLNAADVSILSWKQHAVARMWGDADIFPGMCVDILTAKQRYRYVKTDGRWLVRAVTHSADRQSYQTQLLLVRPENTYYPPQGSYRPFWDMTTPTRARPWLALDQGKWVSSWANRSIQVATA